MTAWARNGLLVVLSLTAGLAVCEAALRLADTRYEQAAEPPVREYHWTNTVPHPDARTEHKVLYNRFGNRQHRDFSERDMQEGVHIAFFGDSFTEGLEVPVQYTFAEVLDHLLNAQEAGAGAPARRFHVHNFGVTATGPGSQYLRYRGFAHKKRLDHVFYVHCSNDFANLRLAGLYSLSATGDLVRRMRRPTSAWIRFLSGFRLTYLALDVWQRLAGTNDAVPNAGSAEPQAIGDGDLVFEALLSRWRDEAEANGSAFHIVLLPMPNTAAQFHRRVRAGLFDVFDLHDCFADESPGSVWEDWRFQHDSHMHEGGHMVVAHCLYRFLEGRLGFATLADEALARMRHVYYRAFADDEGWQGHRFVPAAPWPLPTPGPADAAEAARIRVKHLALETDTEGERRRIVHEVRQGEPVARGGGWAVYASPRHRLVVYVRSPCDDDGTNPAGRLFLHAFPVNLGELASPKEHEAGFLQLEFYKDPLSPGSWRDGRDCVVARSLGLAGGFLVFTKLRTGEYRQRPDDAALWEAEFPFDSAEQVAAATAAVRRDYDAFANAAPMARSHWNIHVRDRRLVFLKAPCEAGDLRGIFFQQMYPADPGDAGDDLAPGGFALREDVFSTQPPVVAVRIDDKCLLRTTLPTWPVATIVAGQRQGEAVLWATTFHLDIERHRRAWAAVRAEAPTASGDFDVHRRGADLVYVREPCDERDAAARFFLHVFSGAAFTNLDFDFRERGVVADGRCVAVVRLPDQDIDRIRTGQFVAGEGALWSVEL